MMAEGGSCDVVCDFCEDEQAVSFCDECHSKVCTFCEALHIRQKQTKIHNLTKIEKVKLLVLNVKCSFCDGQAEKFCSECNVRLCTKCAMSHHKLCDIPGSPKQASGDLASDGHEITATYNVSDQTTNLKENSHEGLPHDSSKLLIKDSVPQRSKVIVKDFHDQSGVWCDLCEEEIAACFCEDCQKQICAFCQQGHTKQKRTKYHKLSAIEYTKRSILHIMCSSCNQNAEKVCNQCEVPLCTKCSDAHHYLTDTLIPRKEISNTESECGDQVSGRHFRPRSLVYKSDTMNPTLLSPESGINQARFHQVGDQECDGEVSGKVNKSKGRSGEGGTGKCDNYKRGQAFQDIHSFGMAGERKSSPVLCDLCDEAATSFCDTCKLKLGTFCHEAQTRRKGGKPGNPAVERIYTDSVDIVWTGVDNFCEGDVYQVRTEKIIHTNKWRNQNFKKNSGKITGLKPGVSYVFKVRLVKANGEEFRYSDKSEEVTTHRSYASELVPTLSPVKKNRNGPDIFALPMQENLQARDDKAMTRKYDIGSRTKEDNEKTIMLVGATGTGKSTLVDGLANYLMGVRLGDTFRFTLMEEENKEKQYNQAVSQTDWITTYSFNPVPGSRLKYRLNVIDTPGFGDPRGLARDQNIVDQIRHLLEAIGETGVKTIDAVCFLIKAPDSRFTATQTCMINGIMSLFGKDIEGNICTLITFADGSDPPVLHAVYKSKLPFGKTFTFNNSALFSNPCHYFTSLFWDMSLHSFDSFITHINSLERRSIQLTKEVLEVRRCLDVTKSNLQFNINEGRATFERLYSDVRLFQNNKDEIIRNAHFTYEVLETKIVKVDLPVGIHVMNCMVCNRTCHEKCVISDDDQKRRCPAIGPDGYCQQCPNKCFWDLYRYASFKLDIVTEKVKKTYEDMKKKYEVATGNTMSLEQVIDKMKEELEVINSKVEEIVDNMRKCNNRLKEISLRPDPLGMVEQIDVLIQAEKHESKPGYLGRIEVLQQFRERAEIGESVKKFRQMVASATSCLNASVVSKKNKGFFSNMEWFNMRNK